MNKSIMIVGVGGQGSLLATPVQICSVMAAIARGGVYAEPYLIEGEKDENGIAITDPVEDIVEEVENSNTEVQNPNEGQS